MGGVDRTRGMGGRFSERSEAWTQGWDPQPRVLELRTTAHITFSYERWWGF